jgi:hypothetical protein
MLAKDGRETSSKPTVMSVREDRIYASNGSIGVAPRATTMTFSVNKSCEGCNL